MKKQRFYLKMIAGSLIRRRSRMLVALLAVAVGAAILSGLIIIYIDVPRQMGQEFRSYGANLVLVPRGPDEALSAENLREARRFFPESGIVGIAPYRYHAAKINEQPFMAAGTDIEEVKKTSPWWYLSGGWPGAGGEALIGKQVADTIRLVPGSVFTLTGTALDGKPFSRDFTVSGILETGGTEEAFVVMSFDDFEAAVGSGGFDIVECSLSVPEAVLQNAASQIDAEVPALAARLVKQVTQSENAVLGKLQALVYLVTVIILLLTMMCVATTMMAVVAERRSEIGLKKALGASNGGIIAEFIGEGILLGCGGGLLGTIFGFIFADMVSKNVFGRGISFLPLLIPLTLFISAAITALACLPPVRSAVDVEPAIVLRGE